MHNQYHPFLTFRLYWLEFQGTVLLKSLGYVSYPHCGFICAPLNHSVHSYTKLSPSSETIPLNHSVHSYTKLSPSSETIHPKTKPDKVISGGQKVTSYLGTFPSYTVFFKYKAKSLRESDIITH